ncbi:MAG TPA: FecR domain-containing protein [Polyangia bacterium]|nr:FecR domain-containing protein [Polyangia bacterium]
MSTTAPRRSGWIALLVLGATLIAVAAVVSRLHLASRRQRAASPASGAATAGIDAGTFQVTSAAGVVEAGRNGAWRPIKNGDTLTRADAVRTAAGAGATLRLSAGTEVELREKVEIGLDRLPSGATVDLRHGKVFARVSGTDGLEINAHDTRTANEGPAHFVVMSDDNGRVSVAALSGQARFTAGGKSLSVPAGSESSSVAGGPPSDPERIPEEVLLDVVWPAEEQRHATDRAAVEGHAHASTKVTINGTAATVGPDGRFNATVPLRVGKNTLDVSAEDVIGRTRHATGTVVRRGPPPSLTPEPADLWNKAQ